jgi:hypothetical protein
MYVCMHLLYYPVGMQYTGQHPVEIWNRLAVIFSLASHAQAELVGYPRAASALSAPRSPLPHLRKKVPYEIWRGPAPSQ